MKYRIGEIAEFFGLTKEAIRYYERRGIVQSTRDEASGYRYYEREEITRLKQIRTFESLGFTLDEAQAMVVESSFDDMEERLQKKLQELKKREETIARMQQELEHQQRCIDAYKAGKIELRMMPETYFWRRVPDEASAGTEEDRANISRQRNEEKQWVNAMPPVVLCGLQYDRELHPKKIYGSVLDRERAEKLGLPLSCAVLLPSRLCVSGYAQAKLEESPNIDHLVKWTQEHGKCICGDIYASLRMVYKNENGERWGVHEFYLPVEEKA